VTEIQQNRWDRLIRRAGNIVGGGSQVNDTLNELFPVIDVERVPGELLALMGTRIAFGGSSVAAGAGLRPQIQIFNPVGSGAIITVTRLIMSPSATTTLQWNTSLAAFTTLTARGTLRDTRLRTPAANASIAEIRVQSSAVPVGLIGTARILANTVLTVEDENSVAVLSPGFGLACDTGTVAITLNAAFYWRERTAEPSELNL